MQVFNFDLIQQVIRDIFVQEADYVRGRPVLIANLSIQTEALLDVHIIDAHAQVNANCIVDAVLCLVEQKKRRTTGILQLLK